jgi:hypothetical protein
MYVQLHDKRFPPLRQMIVLPRRHHFNNRDILTTFDDQIRVNTQLGKTEMADLTEIEPTELPESRGLMAAILSRWPFNRTDDSPARRTQTNITNSTRDGRVQVDKIEDDPLQTSDTTHMSCSADDNSSDITSTTNKQFRHLVHHIQDRRYLVSNRQERRHLHSV